MRVAAVVFASVLVVGCGASDARNSSESGGGSGGHPTKGGTGGSGGSSAGGSSSGGTSAGGSAGATQTNACPGGEAAFASLIKELDADLAQHGVKSASVGVLCDGERIFARGIGVANSAGELVDEHTRFQLASMTKTFTATMAAELAAEGVVDLKAPITSEVSFLNTQAPYDRPFTYTELLSHTSGFTQYFEGNIDLSLEQYFQGAGPSLPLWSPPGVVHNYNNLGFALAGLVLEKAKGQKYADLIEQKLFVPANMTDSRMRATVVQSEGHYAEGHNASGQAIVPTNGYLATEYYGPMGGAWSSAADLMTFAKLFLHKGQGVLAEGVTDEVMTPRTPTGTVGESYGLGMFIDDLGNTTAYQHTGSVEGYLSDLEMYPDQGFAIVVLVASDQYLPYISDHALKLFTGVEPQGLPPDPPLPGDPQEQAGTYQSSELGTITVTQNGGSLSVDIPSQGLNGAQMSLQWRDNYSVYVPSYDYDAMVTFWRINGKIQFVVTDFGVGQRTSP